MSELEKRIVEKAKQTVNNPDVHIDSTGAKKFGIKEGEDIFICEIRLDVLNERYIHLNYWIPGFGISIKRIDISTMDILK